jgi:hypothetical protein
LRSKPHPEQGYRACLGLLALAREYGEQRLEAASTLALRLGSPTRKSVKSILESGRDRRPTTSEPLALELPVHSNVRGPGYYHCRSLTTDDNGESDVDEPDDRNPQEPQAQWPARGT